MKKIFPLLFFALVLFLLFISFARCGSSYEQKVFQLVLKNEEKLRQDIRDCNENDKPPLINGVEEITKLSNGIIRYECGSEGIMTSSFQYGFYYSPDDTPSSCGTAWTGFQELTPSEQEGSWFWEEENGDNRYNTKKICDNFYYYSASN